MADTQDVTTYIEAILTYAQRQCLNICTHWNMLGFNQTCNICLQLRAYQIQYAVMENWPVNKRIPRYMPRRLCSSCISCLDQKRCALLEHAFEMYKVIRCIHSDVAKYMLKFIHIPSITGI